MADYSHTLIDIGAAANDGSGTPARTAASGSINLGFSTIFNSMLPDTSTLDVKFFGNQTFLNPDSPPVALSSKVSLAAKFNGGETGGKIEFVAQKDYGTTNDKDSVFRIFTSNNGVDVLGYELNQAQSSIFNGNVSPAVTETLDLGSPSNEWDNLFVQNSPTVSDIRKKNDLGPINDKIIDLMRKLDPRIFSRKETVVKEAVPKHVIKQQKTSIEKQIIKKIEIINGVPTLVERTVDVKVKQFKEVQIVGEDGKLLFDDVPALILKGKVIVPATKTARMYSVPEMENVVISAQDEVVVTHGRPHTGFMAQPVKAMMEELGIKDWAGYVYHNENGEDIHALRLQEFISPILAYVQQIEKRIILLEK